MLIQQNTRLPQLDVLRACAILLVLARHADYGTVFYTIGWSGVDLFFVLSGYLISRLLFSEFQQHGRIRPGRFLVRRAFKIYPSYYIFLVCFLIGSYLERGAVYGTSDILTEVFFIQNIRHGIHYHTWSLGAEEQFYLGISAILFVYFMVLKLSVKFIPWVCGALILLFTMLRFWVSFIHEPGFFIQNLCRMDGFIWGTWVASIQAKGGIGAALKSKLKVWWFVVGILGMVPVMIWGENFTFMLRWGFTPLYAAYFSWVMLAVYYADTQKWKNIKWLQPITFIGVCSYNIYVWHLWVRHFMENYLSLEKGSFALLFIGTSILTGIIFTYLIEKPFLALRR